MSRAIVVDLDGTLCDSAWREHHARNGDWDLFHGGIAEDKPHADVAQLIHSFWGTGLLVVGCTGRPARYRPATERWLMKHEIPLDFVLMRNDYDFGSDAKIKPKLLMEWHSSTEEAEMMTAQDRVLVVLEDRDKVVEAWRGLGFNCWQVRPGGY